jgi:Spy/CpxP family protein refolding chaperone
MKRLITPRALAAVFVLSLGLAAGSSFAGPHGDRHGKWFGGWCDGARAHDMAPAFHGRAFAYLRDELKLDARQEALWKEARAFAFEQRDAMRARMIRERDEINALLERPDSDLRAAAKRMDELRAEGWKLRDAARERWFAVYDALGAEQKETVRLFFKDGAERMGRFGERFRERPGRGHPWRGPRQAPAAPPDSASAPAQ